MKTPSPPQVCVQNASLAGGVVVGATADMMMTPGGALIAGTLAGAVSTLGFTYLTVRLCTIYLRYLFMYLSLLFDVKDTVSTLGFSYLTVRLCAIIFNQVSFATI